LQPRRPLARQPVGNARRRLQLELFFPMALGYSADRLLAFGLPFGLERQIAGPQEAAKVLRSDGLELELIFGTSATLDAVDARPARLGIKSQPNAVAAFIEQPIFELETGTLKCEIAAQRIDLGCEP